MWRNGYVGNEKVSKLANFWFSPHHVNNPAVVYSNSSVCYLPLQKLLENPSVGIASSSDSNIFFQTQVFHLMFYPGDENNARLKIHLISAYLWIEAILKQLNHV